MNVGSGATLHHGQCAVVQRFGSGYRPLCDITANVFAFVLTADFNGVVPDAPLVVERGRSASIDTTRRLGSFSITATLFASDISHAVYVDRTDSIGSSICPRQPGTSARNFWRRGGRPLFPRRLPTRTSGLASSTRGRCRSRRATASGLSECGRRKELPGSALNVTTRVNSASRTMPTDPSHPHT